MARLARIVVPGLPHHVTQRGNGRAKVFFTPKDYALYKNLLVEHCRVADVGIWAWCLMPNHVHLILTPADPDGLRRALAKVHRAYAGVIHTRQKKTGHFWQGRFGAVAMDEDHLLSAVRYVGLNPVRARRRYGPGADEGPVADVDWAVRSAQDGCRDFRRIAQGRERQSAGGQRSISEPDCRPTWKSCEAGKARQAAKRK